MPTLTTPGVYFQTVTPERPIAAIPTDIAAFIGIAVSGPLHQPVRLESWAQFQTVFGPFTGQGYLAYSVKAFYENGGRTCWVVRIAAPEVITQTDSAAVQPADRASSLVLSVDGFAPGAVVSVRQGTALATDVLLRDVDGPGRRLMWDRPLDAAFNLALPLDFASGAGHAQGILADESGLPTLLIQARDPGIWGNRLAVRVGRAYPAAAITSGGVQPATRMISLVDRVESFRVGSLVRVFQDQPAAPPLETYRIVTAVDPAEGALSWDDSLDADLAPGDSFDLARAITFESVTFSLSVYLDGHLRETLSDLSLLPDRSLRYDPDNAHRQQYHAEQVVEVESRLIRVTDLDSPSPFPARLPDPVAADLSRGVRVLAGGRDGLAALTPGDFTGDRSLPEKWGLRTLEDVDEVALVAAPDILIRPVAPVQFAPLPPRTPDPCLPCDVLPPSVPPVPPPVIELPPQFSLADIFDVQQALIAHCELLKDRFALLDAPDPAQDSGAIQGWRGRFESSYGGLYYSWVLVFDPLRLGGQVVRAIPPSGHVAGVIAATDLVVGVHKAPANVALQWAQDLTRQVEPEVQGILNPQGINCLRLLPGRGLRVYGARTVSSDASWRFVNVRRLMMMIEEAVSEAIQWAVFEPNDFYLRQTLILAISSFLDVLWQRGALAGAAPEQAYFVKADDENNPPPVVDAGQLIIDVGVAPVIPAEFVVFRIGRTEDELEISE